MAGVDGFHAFLDKMGGRNVSNNLEKALGRTYKHAAKRPPQHFANKFGPSRFSAQYTNLTRHFTLLDQYTTCHTTLVRAFLGSCLFRFLVLLQFFGNVMNN